MQHDSAGVSVDDLGANQVEFHGISMQMLRQSLGVLPAADEFIIDSLDAGSMFSEVNSIQADSDVISHQMLTTQQARFVP